MVWSQYVYEASAGLDVDTTSAVYSSDDDEQNVTLNICDWELQYSDELWDLWDLLKMFLRDAYLDNVLLTHDFCTYNDFVEFCYESHYDVEEYTGAVPFHHNLRYIWQVMWNEMKYLEFAPGANYSHFVSWVIDHSDINNLTI